MILSSSTIVERKDHVQYQLNPDDCTCSLAEHNIAINDHNDVMVLFIGLYRSIQI